MRFLMRAKKPTGKAAKADTKGRRSPRKPEADLESGRARAPLAIGALVAGTLAVLGAGVYAWQVDAPNRIASWAYDGFMGATAGLGLSVREVYAVGRTETARSDILAALGLKIGDPILDFSPEEARERLETLGWVRAAEVRRTFPDKVVVRLEEREAIAIWQHDQRFVLIDSNGIEIGEKDVHRHSHLKIVVGPDAPQHTAELLALLGSEPELEDRVVAAVRVGARRWNLRLEGGIDVSLPEEGASMAWRKLADYQREHEILSRAVGEIDLRHPDRMTVQLTEPGLQEVMGRGKGEET
ncbi:MAG: FtsQ-type POTRA domain-containing protein [Alphaproteobacteria bacterium]|jgi:cell division protein FtsQ|uniref:cell division protein FtsQ/DivIB n=1 Tax=Pacificispira sp. TaxID=2888761 RepID=UPI001B0985C4|nr:FtsQ-type POTRA domain-containing protein [Alphaproteobacteria bacterium]MEC9265928.1 FtsQ-type POTRA domain-containing protein [Pseudomonadota bacterium]